MLDLDSWALWIGRFILATGGFALAALIIAYASLGLYELLRAVRRRRAVGE